LSQLDAKIDLENASSKDKRRTFSLLFKKHESVKKFEILDVAYFLPD
jgi:hypothetical protein